MNTVRYKYINILLLPLLILVACYSRAFSVPVTSNSLRGVVRDNAGRPLEGAVVSIPDLKAGAATDSAGFYKITNLPTGRYTVVAGMVSFGRTTVSISLNGETVQDFVLTESAIESREVVITGTSRATEIKRSPIPIVAISHEYLQENISSNIIEAITKTPGVSALTTGPNVSKPFIRGLGYNRVLTLYDGQRQEGQQWGDEHGIEVDEYSVDRIEVIKGPSSLIYGSDALAGVVNLIPTQPAPEGKVIGSVIGEYMSNNREIGSSAMLSGNNKGFYWLGRVSNKQAQDFRNKIDGPVYGTNYRETDGNASFGLNRSWGYSRLDLTLFDNLLAVPTGDRDSASRLFTRQITEIDTFRPIVSDKELNSYAIPTIHQRIQHYRAVSSSSFNIGKSRLNLILGFERSIRREFSHPESGEVPGLYLQLNTGTYDVKYFFAEYKGWELTAGVNGMYQVNNATQGTEFLIPSYRQFDLGPFLLAKKTMGRLDISGGLRLDNRTFHNDALFSKTDPSTGYEVSVPASDTAGASQVFYQFDHTFSGMSGSLGTSYIISKQVSLKGNLARGFRAPNIYEISANGVHPGTNLYQVGNPDFKPEFSLQEDLGMDFISQHLSISAAIFNNRISNYIYNQKLLSYTGADSVIVPGTQTFQFHAATAQLYGGELDVDIHPHPLDWLHFENIISVVYGNNKGTGSGSLPDSERYLPFIPPLHGVSELRGDFKHLGHHLKSAFFKMQLEYYATQNRVYTAFNTETATPGYALCNMALGADVTNRKGHPLFNISIFANNILNEAYQNHLSRLKYFEPYPNDPRGHGIYNAGRNIGARLTVPFSVK